MAIAKSSMIANLPAAARPLGFAGFSQTGASQILGGLQSFETQYRPAPS
jgi:hypothetical protein